MFGFLQADKYGSIAKEAINRVESSNGNPNDVIMELAQKQHLNKHQTQRVVEEYNVNMFLNKLKEGTQHEDFLLANPVMDECEKWVGVPIGKPQTGIKKEASMEKVASSYDQVFIPNSAFEYGEIDNFDNIQMQGEILDESGDLEKVAFDKSYYKNELAQEELIKEANYHINRGLEMVSRDLIKIANQSPAIAKQVIYGLVKVGSDDLAEDVLVNCKYNTQEITKSSMQDEIYTQTDLNKFASFKDILEELPFAKTLKNIVTQGGPKSEEAAKKIIEYSKKHPAVPISLALVAHNVKGLIDNEDKENATKIGRELTSFAQGKMSD